jgi:hypothetical protein
MSQRLADYLTEWDRQLHPGDDTREPVTAEEAECLLEYFRILDRWDRETTALRQSLLSVLRARMIAGGHSCR